MEMVREHRKFVVPEIITGENARIYAGKYASNFHSDTVLIATDTNVFRQKWILEILQSLDEAGTEYVIFSDIEPNPRDYNVMAGADVYLSEECTGILAIGGGVSLTVRRESVLLQQTGEIFLTILALIW